MEIQQLPHFARPASDTLCAAMSFCHAPLPPPVGDVGDGSPAYAKCGLTNGHTRYTPQLWVNWSANSIWLIMIIIVYLLGTTINLEPMYIYIYMYYIFIRIYIYFKQPGSKLGALIFELQNNRKKTPVHPGVIAQSSDWDMNGFLPGATFAWPGWAKRSQLTGRS